MRVLLVQNVRGTRTLPGEDRFKKRGLARKRHHALLPISTAVVATDAGAARWQFGHVWQGPRRALAGRWDSFGGQARSRGQRLGYVMSAVAGQGVLLHEEGAEGMLEGGDRCAGRNSGRICCQIKAVWIWA